MSGPRAHARPVLVVWGLPLLRSSLLVPMLAVPGVPGSLRRRMCSRAWEAEVGPGLATGASKGGSSARRPAWDTVEGLAQDTAQVDLGLLLGLRDPGPTPLSLSPCQEEGGAGDGQEGSCPASRGRSCPQPSSWGSGSGTTQPALQEGEAGLGPGLSKGQWALPVPPGPWTGLRAAVWVTPATPGWSSLAFPALWP